MNIPQNIIVHHTAISRAKNPAQFDAVNRYHKDKGWGMIGYQYLIEADGTVKKGRRENQTGAHTSQKWMNVRSIGICLTGNFDIEEPTLEQVKALHSLVVQLQNKYNIPVKKVFPHRHFAKYKSCWGKLLPDDILGYCRTEIENSNNEVKLEKWQEREVKWASKYIKDVPALLAGNVFSLIALIHRAVTGDERYNQDK